jgi:hypothetical protein
VKYGGHASRTNVIERFVLTDRSSFAPPGHLLWRRVAPQFSTARVPALVPAGEERLFIIKPLLTISHMAVGGGDLAELSSLTPVSIMW